MKVDEDKFSLSSFGDGGDLDCFSRFQNRVQKISAHDDRRFDTAIRCFGCLQFLDSGVCCLRRSLWCLKTL